MDTEMKARWVAALRYGKYRQTRGRLRRNNAFCCMGVLCEVAEVPRRETGYVFDNVVRCTYLPEGWLGLDKEQTDRLAVLNDVDKRRFKTIANWIEKNL